MRNTVSVVVTTKVNGFAGNEDFWEPAWNSTEIRENGAERFKMISKCDKEKREIFFGDRSFVELISLVRYTVCFRYISILITLEESDDHELKISDSWRYKNITEWGQRLKRSWVFGNIYNIMYYFSYITNRRLLNVLETNANFVFIWFLWLL